MSWATFRAVLVLVDLGLTLLLFLVFSMLSVLPLLVVICSEEE